MQTPEIAADREHRRRRSPGNGEMPIWHRWVVSATAHPLRQIGQIGRVLRSPPRAWLDRNKMGDPRSLVELRRQVHMAIDEPRKDEFLVKIDKLTARRRIDEAARHGLDLLRFGLYVWIIREPDAGVPAS